MARLELKKCPYCGSEVDTVSVKEKDGNLCIEVKAKDRWIPCSERLPENNAKCLVYTSDKRICIARWDGEWDEQGAWYIISDEFPKLYRIKNVPFWMPLPEPPKE